MAELRAFVFSDIAASVRIKRKLPGTSDAERDTAFVNQILTPHRQRIDEFLEIHQGRIVSTAGDGHFLVFADATSAVLWAADLMQSHFDSPIGREASDDGLGIEVRISVHVGAPQVDPRDPNNFVGKTVDYAARLNDFASGGQILVSRATLALVEDAGLDGIRFHPHGRRRLKGIGEVEIYELLTRDHHSRALRAVPDAPTPKHWTVISPSSAAALHSTHTALTLPARVGPTVGKYELIKSIGTGGMGDVWLAKHPQFDRPRALKVIKPEMVRSGGEQVVKRFYREIKAIGALSHPNVVVAIDSSLPEDPTHYLVMEYIDGISTHELVARGGELGVADAGEIVRQAAVGLQYIHRQGLVHRDIKPSNLMVAVVDDSSYSPGGSGSAGGSGSKSPDGRVPLVKILDLGLALLVTGDDDRLTRLDQDAKGIGAMGTAMYMSPEQWLTSSVDIRSDIYSLGCTLYHLLAGRPPFYDSDLRPQRAHELAPVPTLPMEVGAPRELNGVLARMLAKHADDRFQTPGEVAEALAPFCAGQRVVSLVDRVRGHKVGGRAMGSSYYDTLAGSSPSSETSPGRLQKLSTSTGRRSWPSVLASIVAIGLLAGGAVTAWQYFATAGQEQVLAARAGELDTAAKFAAREVAREIDKRFRILGELSTTPLLQKQLSEIAREPGDSSLWEPLQSWIDRELLDHNQETPAESWFINSQRGIQVARAPRSADSRGQDYSHRDYFNGQETPLPVDAKNVPPIAAPHQSTVYQSTTTGQLKVAFSVPIRNGADLAADREVVGVLAMSVDLGDFRVLENELRRGLEVVLIDLRTDYIEELARRGLILHHNELPSRQPGKPPLRIDAKLLAQIETLLAQPASSDSPRLVTNYADPLGRSTRKFRGVVQPVVISRRNEAGRDTKWLVLVQEAVE